MDISDTRKCNVWNLEKLAHFLGADPVQFMAYYQELSDDRDLLNGINDRMKYVRDRFGFTKGIFRNGHVDSLDWFAFERVIAYVLIRYLKPQACLETGVYYGGNSVFMLAALKRNGHGKLVSIDLPDAAIVRDGEVTSHPRHPLVGDSEYYEPTLKPGFIVPDYLQEHWEFVEGDSLAEIPKRSETFDFYLHDSDHSMSFLMAELAAATPLLSKSAVILVDDIDWSNAFFAYCVQKKLCPVLFTDNGKDNLRVRSGLIKLDHPNNRVYAMTGAEPAMSA